MMENMPLTAKKGILWKKSNKRLFNKDVILHCVLFFLESKIEIWYDIFVMC